MSLLFPEYLHPLFFAGLFEALSVAAESLSCGWSVGVDGLMVERGVKRGVGVLFVRGMKQGGGVLVGCWNC